MFSIGTAKLAVPNQCFLQVECLLPPVGDLDRVEVRAERFPQRHLHHLKVAEAERLRHRRGQRPEVLAEGIAYSAPFDVDTVALFVPTSTLISCP